jgi:hypothetical protein
MKIGGRRETAAFEGSPTRNPDVTIRVLVKKISWSWVDSDGHTRFDSQPNCDAAE